MVYFELFTVDYLNHHHYHLHNPHNVQVLQKLNFTVEINLFSRWNHFLFLGGLLQTPKRLCLLHCLKYFSRVQDFQTNSGIKQMMTSFRQEKHPTLLLQIKNFCRFPVLEIQVLCFFLLFVKPSFLQHSKMQHREGCRREKNGKSVVFCQTALAK